MKEILALELWKQLMLLAPLGCVLIAAAITDAMHRKVYNKLTYPAFVIGLILHAVAMGVDGLLSGLGGGGLIFIIGLLTLPTGWMRAGDIKLLMVVGATLGLKATGQIFFYATLVGFVMGVGRALFAGYLLEIFRRLWAIVKGYFYYLVYRTKNLVPKVEEDERSMIPFAIAILGGGILTLCEFLYGVPSLLTHYASALQ